MYSADQEVCICFVRTKMNKKFSSVGFYSNTVTLVFFLFIFFYSLFIFFFI